MHKTKLEVELLRESILNIIQDAITNGNSNSQLLNLISSLRRPEELALAKKIEQIINRAKEILVEQDPSPIDIWNINQELEKFLPEMDPFFIRWRYYMKIPKKKPNK